MNPGTLDQRIELYRPTNARTSTGGFTTTYSLVATVWGRVVPLTSQELWIAGQRRAEATHEIEIRSGGDGDLVGADWRVSHASRTFEVVGSPTSIPRTGRVVLRVKETMP